MERKIGEIFEYNGEWLQCVEQPKKYDKTVCAICAFQGNGNCELDRCSGTYRSDKKSVIFKKLEKVGEPYSCNYYGDNRLIMMQEYNLFNLDDVTNEDKIPMYITDYKHKRIAIEIKETKEDMEENKTTFPKDDNALTRTAYAYVNGKISDKELIKSIKEMSDEYPYNKNNLKSFSLELAKQGKPVCTRDGRKARILCYDLKGAEYPIVAAVETRDRFAESIFGYDKNGRFDHDTENNNDLMMLPEKKEGWVNIYKSDNGTYYTGAIFYEKNDALVNTAEIEITTGIPRDCIDTVKIEWEE